MNLFSFLTCGSGGDKNHNLEMSVNNLRVLLYHEGVGMKIYPLEVEILIRTNFQTNFHTYTILSDKYPEKETMFINAEKFKNLMALHDTVFPFNH